MINKTNKPKIRFGEFERQWLPVQIDEVLDRIVNPVNVNEQMVYKQIGIRSHGKGIFHKDYVSGKELGNKRVFWLKKDLFVVNIVFAWEQAIAKTTENEEGLIASHRFPLYQPIDEKLDLDFIVYFFLRKKGKYILELASPGGAGRNKTLGQKEFAKSKISIPSFREQQKIASFLTSIDQNINFLKTKKDKLKEYKKGVLQRIFDREIRFKDQYGNNFPEWKKVKLKEVLVEHKTKNEEDKFNEVFSVSKSKGVVNQVEHLGRSYAAKSINHYKVVYPYDIVYTKSPTSDFPFGIIKQNTTERAGVVSTLYAVFKPSNEYLGFLLQSYFDSWVKTYNYLNPLVQKGAKNTLNVNNKIFLDGKPIFLPTSKKEQELISNFIKTMDKEISILNEQIENFNQFKKGLLQQMFV